MSLLNRLKNDKKFLLIAIGILFATFIVPYLTLPALALWWFYKTKKLSNNTKRIVMGLLIGFLLVGSVSAFISYANDPTPQLTVLEPETHLTTQSDNIYIKGTYKPIDRKVWVNGNKINASNGNFETNFPLKDGENKIEISVGDWKRTKVLLTIIHEVTNSETKAESILTPSITSSIQNQTDQIEQQIESKIRASLKNKTNNNKNKIEEMRINKSFGEHEGYVAIITINADDNLSEDLIKKGIWKDMANIYTALYKDSTHIVEATIIANMDMTDKYGNKSKQVVLKTSLVNSEANRVNWSQNETMLYLEILPAIWNTQIDRFIK